MKERDKAAFDPALFLANAGLGRQIVHLKARGAFFLQGNPADSIFHLQTGRAKLTVVSKEGKEAMIAMVSAGDFVGEESLAAVGGLHMATATEMTACTAMKVEG
jgi:CRP/FNR family transcriptional regulator, cyclic AMP receptor protein